jgi:hypothetical protein
MAGVSVIIPTHDRPRLLPQAVASARAAGTDVEVVVVDDASTDETAAVCRRLEGIRYVRLERNLRVAGARNAGLRASDREYVSFLDDDDRRLPKSLDLQLAALEARPEAAMVYGQALLADQRGAPTGRLYPADCPQGDIFWQLVGRNFIPCGSAVFRRSCLERVGLLDEGAPGLDDWDLWIRVAELYAVIAVAQPVVVWRQSTPASGQGSSQAAALVALSRRKFLEGWMKLPRAQGAPRAVRREARRRFSVNMANHLVWEAARALGCGQLAQAVRNLSAAVRLFPSEAARAPFTHPKVRTLLGRRRRPDAAGQSRCHVGEALERNEG